MKKSNIQLCHLHDEKAIKLLMDLCISSSSIADANVALAIHLRQMELHNLCAEGECVHFTHLCDIKMSPSSSWTLFAVTDFFKGTGRLVSLRLSLSYAVNAKFIFHIYANQAENITDDIVKQMENFEKMLQSILKKTVQVSMKSMSATVTDSFKSNYALTLRRPEKFNGLKMATYLVQLLDKIGNLPNVEP